MPIEFVAHVTGVDDEDCLVAGVAERGDGTGRALIFQAAHKSPDEQEVRLGMDTTAWSRRTMERLTDASVN
jgi:hypothetical protein